MTVFVDANVFLYALGTDHPYRDPCRRLVRQLARRELIGETSTEVLQEVVHYRRTRGGGTPDAVDRGREVLNMGLPVHEFCAADLELALDLLTRHPELPTRDAVHAATAGNRGIEVILSADRDFDALEIVERVDPVDTQATARLRA